MPFARSHLYLTIHWKPINYPAESGQVGIRFAVDGVNPAQSIVDGCKTAVSTFWSTAANKVPSSLTLDYLRLARIATDGHYAPGTISYDAVYASTVAGGSLPQNPFQVAAATTLTTSVPKGAAALGRLYFPEIAASAGQGYWSLADVDARSVGVAKLISDLTVVLGGPAIIASKGTLRHPAPLSRVVTGVFTGQRPDVQRRRAKGLKDIRGTAKTVTLPTGGDPGQVFEGGTP